MQFKTREFLLWIHLHFFDAITIFDIINTMGNITIQKKMSMVKNQDQKSILGLLTGGEKGRRNLSETIPERRDKDVTFTKDRKFSHVIQYS